MFVYMNEKKCTYFRRCKKSLEWNFSVNFFICLSQYNSKSIKYNGNDGFLITFVKFEFITKDFRPVSFNKLLFKILKISLNVRDTNCSLPIKCKCYFEREI